MELVSETIIRMSESVPYSTIVSRSKKWFDDVYVMKEKKPIEESRTPIPKIGKIYTWFYDPLTKDEMDFFSWCPLTFIIGYKVTQGGHLLPYGINLSFIPPSMRIKVLDTIIRLWNTQVINPNIEKIKAGETPILDIPLYYDVAKKVLQNSGFEFAIRSYRLERFQSKPMIVSYEDWYKICTFPIRYIEKMQIRAIYWRYWRSLDGSGIGKRKDVEIVKTKIKEVQDYVKKRESRK
jgi:hypothetical protein